MRARYPRCREAGGARQVGERSEMDANSKAGGARQLNNVNSSTTSETVAECCSED
jgi:hypothetical protein